MDCGVFHFGAYCSMLKNVALAGFILVSGCGLSAVDQCRLGAMAQLPVHEPELLTPLDLYVFVSELKACKPEATDAGVR
jgi:hypothetical protein